jgi:lipopolysaccharide/colanic/teichoic acid biosynthesis glycosyltransferase
MRSLNHSALTVSDVLELDIQRETLDQESFHEVIALERKRTERSGSPFALMLIDVSGAINSGRGSQLLDSALSVLLSVSRDTDVIGWYEADAVIGVMFTELSPEEKSSLLDAMHGRLMEGLKQCLTSEQLSRVDVSFHLFPEEWEHDASGFDINPALYPETRKSTWREKLSSAVKRTIDVVGSVFAILLFSPVFLITAILVKLSSAGPILYRQPRVGQFGQAFTFLKFRSMHCNNDPKIHREYVASLIGGKADKHGAGVYKLVNDPRITPLGRILRKTSIDELPQLLNVLTGSMSLVGPRPPVPYEFQKYDVWHRRRLLEVKPGITGLWQVMGRSRTTFDEMVRLDLTYARQQSIWLDLKILYRTPMAVIGGDGAC